MITKKMRQYFSFLPLGGAPLSKRQREIINRQGISYAIIIIQLVSLFLSFVFGQENTLVRVILILVACTYICALILNRRHIFLAGLIVVLSTELGLSLNIFFAAYAHGSMSIFSLSTFDLLIMGELIAVILLPTWTVFVFALYNGLYTTFSLFLLPKTPQVAHDMAARGLAFILSTPLTIHLLGAFILYFSLRGVKQLLSQIEQAETNEDLSAALVDQANGELSELEQVIPVLLGEVDSDTLKKIVMEYPLLQHYK